MERRLARSTNSFARKKVIYPSTIYTLFLKPMADIENRTEVSKRIWNGSINIKIILDLDGRRLEYLVQAFRNSYFPLLYPQLIAYFQNFTNKRIASPIWLEFEDVPLRWNIPVGVLYDYLYLPAHHSDRDRCWELNLQINDTFPVEYVMPFTKTNEDSIEYVKCLNEVLKNQLKQSTFVINGSAKSIMQMSEQDSENYLYSITSRNLNQYNSFNNKLIKSVKGVPIRIILPGSDTMSQVPASPAQTLAELVKSTTDDLSEIAHPHAHGIDISRLSDTPLLDIWQIFKHPDNVLYITMIIL